MSSIVIDLTLSIVPEMSVEKILPSPSTSSERAIDPRYVGSMELLLILLMMRERSSSKATVSHLGSRSISSAIASVFSKFRARVVTLTVISSSSADTLIMAPSRSISSSSSSGVLFLVPSLSMEASMFATPGLLISSSICPPSITMLYCIRGTSVCSMP